MPNKKWYKFDNLWRPTKSFTFISRDLEGCFLQACEDHDLVKAKACLELGLSVNILSKDKKKSGELQRIVFLLGIPPF